MSDIQTISRVYEAFANRDLTAVLAVMDPAVTFTQEAPLPWGGVHHGVEGVQTFLTTLLSHLDPQVTVEALYSSGEHVVQIGRTSGRVLGNGKWFDLPEVHIWRLVDGRIVSYQAHTDVPGLLEVLG
ncbi:nuclear transport factor 2 family protein [Kibdelosporangium philippinense]|uniref:Nuclear transport factor 2 family protein n=1 Tax=Kibdelosporangium philippinense TaxID=211113 RepID=A0ABS8ZTX5_9PSEU|nr:nuclear transport factor 2 family protein [Kibdelosporangium philippinense]MCE7011194.1 nuclear transport factor 2 family protein [Kibdelosporangium philippinense]